MNTATTNGLCIPHLMLKHKLLAWYFVGAQRNNDQVHIIDIVLLCQWKVVHVYFTYNILLCKSQNLLQESPGPTTIQRISQYWFGK